MRIHQKLMLVFIGTTLLPILFLSNYFFKQTSQLITRFVSDSYQQVLTQSNSGIEYNIRFYESILDRLTVSESIQSLLTDTEKNQQKGLLQVHKEIKEAVKYIEAYQATDVESIEFYSLGSDLISDGRFLFPYDRLRRMYQLESLPEQKFWRLDHIEGKNYYSLIRPIHSLKEFDKKIGYIKLTIEIPSITTVKETTSLDKMSTLILTDQNGKIMYHPQSNRIGETLASEIVQLSRTSAQSGKELPVTVDSNDYVTWYRKLENVDWMTFLIVPKNAVEEDISNMRRTTVVISAICAIVFVLLVLLISRKMTQGIRRLHTKVSRIGRGVFDDRPPSTVMSGKLDEIAYLERKFDHMTQNLQELIHQNYVIKLERREMEINFLQGQIDSHFLYNTLDAIKNEIDLDEKDNATRMVVALADLFRVSVSKGKSVIRWNDEIMHARHYLDILKVRFDTPYRIHWNMDTRIDDYYTLKIILQPILENAIKHGLKNGHGEIWITGKLTSQAVVIQIMDNGAGMNQEQVDAVFNRTESSSGVGLKNIRERIQMYFGNQYGICLKSAPDEGTEVTLILPILESDKGV